MEFALPAALALCLLAIPAAFAGRQRPRSALALPTLAGFGVVRPTTRQRLARVLPFARAAAVILLAAAVARPRHGQASAVIQAEGIDIALALDISSSMETNRTGSKTRLDAAREVIREFIRGRENDRIGVVVFQLDALALAPLSLDYDALDQAVADVKSGLLPDGTGIGVGIAEALNLLRDSPAASRVVILLTDGEHNATSITPEEAADLAAAMRIRVYTIGVKAGDTQSATRAELDEERLTAIAERTGGLYFSATSQAGLADVYDEIGRLETSRVGREGFSRYTEYGPWLALAAAALLLAEVIGRATVFRRAPR